MIEEQIRRSPQQLSCCARSPPLNTAVPNASLVRSAPT
jgi:hypothetical protein